MSENRISPYSDDELEYFRQLIIEKKCETELEIERLNTGLSKDSRELLDDDSGYSFHMADSASVSTGRESSYIMMDRLQKLLAYLDRAIERIDNKTYGICRVTGKPICRERLEAIPHTELSVEGKMAQQRR